MDDKQSMRNRMKSLLAGQPAEERDRRSGVVLSRLESSPPFKRANCVCLYLALPSEVETRPAIEAAWRSGKRVLVPRVDGRELSLHELTSFADLVVGRFGVEEPDPSRCRASSLDGADCVVLPGVAFDAEGRRLGRGGGYYDRLLVRMGRGPARVGLAFAFQRVARVPESPHDQRVDFVITDQE